MLKGWVASSPHCCASRGVLPPTPDPTQNGRKSVVAVVGRPTAWPIAPSGPLTKRQIEGRTERSIAGRNASIPVPSGGDCSKDGPHGVAEAGCKLHAGQKLHSRPWDGADTNARGRFSQSGPGARIWFGEFTSVHVFEHRSKFGLGGNNCANTHDLLNLGPRSRPNWPISPDHRSKGA